MREVKFRSKTLLVEGWAYGYYAIVKENDLDYSVIYEDNGRPVIVRPQTLGQFTGLKDNKGKEMYEGDIYKRYDSIYLVIFEGFGFKSKKVYDSWLEKNVYNRNEISWLSEIDSDYCYEVIGNIHDNPEFITA